MPQQPGGLNAGECEQVRRNRRTPYRPQRVVGPRGADSRGLAADHLQPHSDRPAADHSHARRIAARAARFGAGAWRSVRYQLPESIYAFRRSVMTDRRLKLAPQLTTLIIAVCCCLGATRADAAEHRARLSA